MNTFIPGKSNQASKFNTQISLRIFAALLASGLSLLFMTGEAAAEIPAIPEIPPAVAASHAELVQQRAALLQERAVLKARAAMNKVECQAVKEKSPEEARCIDSSSAISKDVDRHVQATQQFISNLGPMVVDARNVPSGLPKGLDNAIASAYASAPPGVSDRVRKGFQAVMVRDWAVAKAWFKDALNHDPNNAGLKRLVALTDAPQQPDNQFRAKVDERNEPAGLGGSDAKWAGTPVSKSDPVGETTIDPDIHMPDPMDILFPGLQAMKDREPPVFKTLPDGSLVQLPQESDLEFLFGPPSQPPASKSGKTK